jgi:WD40 repeat protein
MKNKPIFCRTLFVIILQCGLLGVAQSATLPKTLVAFSPDSTRVAVIEGQGRLQVRQASDGALEATFYICHAQALAFCQNGNLLAAAGGQNGSRAKIKVWRLSDHQQLCEIIASGAGALLLALSRDGSLIAAVGSYGQVEIWRTATGERQCVRAMPAEVKSLRFSPDNKLLLVQGTDGTGHSFSAVDGRTVKADLSDR